MSDWNGFGSLDLSSVEESTGGYTRLEPGEYTVKCTEAKIESVGVTKNKKLVADFQNTEGAGSIRMNFNIFHENKQAMEIGQRQLKSFLVAGGHKNPDKPEDVGSLKGLTCKVYVGMGKPWIGNDGQERRNPEIKSFMAASTDAAKNEDLNDDIPF